MNFGTPWLLLLLIPLAAVLWLTWRHPLPSLRIASISSFKKAEGRHTGIPLLRFPFFLYAAALALIVLALAQPRKGIEEIKRRAEGIDIMLAIDLSGSMKAMDVPDSISTENELQRAIGSGQIRSRIEIAKEEIKRFVLRRPNDRIGLVAFAPLPYNVCPPTLDHGWLLANLERLEAGVIGDSTGIAGPIASATQRLKNAESKRRVMLLFTDGSNNVNAQVTPLQAAQLAKNFDVIIYTVGIGSSRAYILQDTFFGQRLIPLQGEFDEKLLKEIASKSDGKYYRAADQKGLEKVLTEIDALEKTSLEQPKFVDYRELGPHMTALALALLALGFLAEHSFLLRLP
ncbi:MAG: hypothetical protein A2X49_07095 [Lentisphaerae bacterium GWF2_52_8]|nr:MAG: hypothetical protein A2X49_07095 [Lentisphaerae bacterium GWF2_52_8]